MAPAVVDASVLTSVLDNKFSFAVNNKPLGSFKSKNIWVNLLTSLAAFIGADNPPLNRKSFVEGIPDLSSLGIGVWM